MAIDKRKAILRTVKEMREKTVQGERELYELLQEKKLSSENLMSHVETWSELYSLSFIQFITLLVLVSGLVPIVTKAAENSDLLDIKASFLEQMKDFELSTETLEKQMDKTEAEKILAGILLALSFNMKAYAHRNRPINTMIEQIRNRVDDYEEIIFEAVSIDASVVSNPEIAQFISAWTLQKNVDNLEKLSKAILGKHPRGKRTVGLDDFRMMTNVLEEIDGELDVETVYEVSQLFNLIAEGKDLGAAIQKHLQTRKKDTRKSKAKTTS